MTLPDLDTFLKSRKTNPLPKGAIAVIFVEDDIGLAACIRHHARLGFKNILLLEAAETRLPADCLDLCVRIACDAPARDVLNQLIDSLAGRWIYYCFNAEFLHFPFCESRNIEELITFSQEERRNAVFGYLIDLYSDDLDANPMGYSLETAHFDKAGYYALPRRVGDTIADRQLDIMGGLRWRFEEHFPPNRRRIDRVSLFKAEKGLRLDDDFLFNEPEYNTYECPWHHSTTVSVCSFRTAKYLKANAGSTFEVNSFMWHKSTKFQWNSQQLMDLGLIEPGQWF